MVDHIEFLFHLLIIFQLLDVISTKRAISVGATEGNKIVQAIMDFCGKFWHVPKVLGATYGGYLMTGMEPTWLATTILVATNSFFFWLVFINNMRIYRKKKGKRV